MSGFTRAAEAGLLSLRLAWAMEQDLVSNKEGRGAGGGGLLKHKSHPEKIMGDDSRASS